MGIFNEFNKKEKPVFTGITRGVGGFGFGAASGDSGGADGSADNPFTSWTDLNAQGFTSTTKHLKLGGQTLNVTIDSGGYANFFIAGDFYTILTHSNGYNSSAGSATGAPTNVSTYTIGNIRGGSEGLSVDSTGEADDFLDFNWQDTDGTTVTAAFFNAMGPQLSTGYKPNSFYLGHTDSETNNAWRFRYSDSTTDSFDSQQDHNTTDILSSDLSSTLQNTWIRDDKILTAYRDAATSDPHASLLSFRHSALAVK